VLRSALFVFALSATLGTGYSQTFTISELFGFPATSGCPEGTKPFAPLLPANDGNLYGSTGGGTCNNGTVFKITPAGSLTTLHTFPSSDDAAGDAPLAALVQGVDGFLYGTTRFGGAIGN